MAKKFKNANGEGSVYKLSGNRRKPWICVFVVGYDEDTAKPITKSSTFATYDEAEYYRQTNVMVKKGLIKEPSDFISLNKKQNIKLPTFKAIYDSLKEKQFSKYPSTMRPYESAFNRLIDLHDIPINLIKYNELNSIFEKYSNKLSASSLNNMKIVSSLVFNDALKRDMVSKNYAEMIQYTPLIKEKRKTEVFSPDELKKIIEIAGNNEIARVVKILCYTGLRISEFFNLKRENIYINERYFIAGSKTKAGRDRVIPIHNDILEDIEYFYKDNGVLLYCRYMKYKSKYDMFKIDYRELMLLLGFEERSSNIHDTRKTFVSIVDRQSQDLNMLKRIVGHSFQDVTNQVYIKKNPQDLVDFIDLIDFKSYYLC